MIHYRTRPIALYVHDIKQTKKKKRDGASD